MSPNQAVAEYAVTCLKQTEGSQIELAALHADYCVWCQRTNVKALNRREFNTGFETLSKLVDFELTNERGKTYCINMQTTSSKAA